MEENLSYQWHLVAKETFGGGVCYCFVFVGLEPRALCILASEPHPQHVKNTTGLSAEPGL